MLPWTWVCIHPLEALIPYGCMPHSGICGLHVHSVFRLFFCELSTLYLAVLICSVTLSAQCLYFDHTILNIAVFRIFVNSCFISTIRSGISLCFSLKWYWIFHQMSVGYLYVFFDKCQHRSFAHFKIQVFVFLLFGCLSFYILYLLTAYQIHGLNVFSPTYRLSVCGWIPWLWEYLQFIYLIK